MSMQAKNGVKLKVNAQLRALYFANANKLDALTSASSNEPDPAKREQLIKAALREHAEQVHHIPLHRQVIPWAMRSNVTAVHRADNWLEWRWVTVGAKP